MDDLEVVLVPLAAYVANMLLDGEPVWILVVGASGGGKTEVLSPLLALPNVHLAATLTEPSLLSGSANKDRAKDAKGGLLRQIGERGVMLMKDFTSILSQNKDARGQVLAALREVYDGRWTRHVGMDGGKTLEWSGHLGVIAGCTEAIDRHHGVISAVGERFVMLRLPLADRIEVAKKALSHRRTQKQMRDELSAAVEGFVAGLGQRLDPSPLSGEDEDLLVSLADFSAKARSSVERDGFHRDIELVPESEAPTRIAIELGRLRDGLVAIGVGTEDALKVVCRVALDSIPKLRRRVLQTLLKRSERAKTEAIATELEHPTGTARRALEDLAAHRLVVRYKGSNADQWELPQEVRVQMGRFPEKSSYTKWRILEARAEPVEGVASTDFSGKPPSNGSPLGRDAANESDRLRRTAIQDGLVEGAL
jgi:hypothetical protein